MTRSVVVVGGGYGGTLVAEALDAFADVVLIDPGEAFVNVAASLRALTRPDFAPNAFFPYRTLLKRARVVRGRAVSVDAAGVSVDDGTRVDADFIVLATGAGYPYPAHPRRRDASVADALRDLRETHDRLAEAGKVLIVGAGPVGLELAGEIREAWPEKRLTVIDRHADILPGYLPEVRADLRRQLATLDVDLRLGTALAEPPAIEPGTLGAITVTTTTGERIDADIWFMAAGSRIRPDYLDDGRLVQLTDRGLVPVTDHLTVIGHDTVYALGDIADLTDPKMATWAQTQAGVVVENLLAQLDGRAPETVYTPTRTLRIFLPLGSKAGAGQLAGPDGAPFAAPLDTVIERKGHDLFTARFAQRFHVER